jgi:hypothetical protein
MIDQCCEYESAVVRAARAGAWDKSLESHAQTCPVCAEAIRVHAAMFSLVTSEQIPPIPDPKLVWLKGQFAERQRRSMRAMRISGVAYSAPAVALLLALFWTIKQGRPLPSIAMKTSIGLPVPSVSPEVLISVVAVTIIILFLFAPSRRRSTSPRV